jgi:hypothetical protein
MKKIVVILLVCTALSAQAQTYDWEIQPGLLTTWSVYTDSIRVAIESNNSAAFCLQNLYLVEIGGGGMAVSGSTAKPGDTTVAYILFRPGYENCNTLYPGMMAEAIIYQLPGWFHTEKAFRIFYTIPFGEKVSFDIPSEPRFVMPVLPDRVPDNASCGSLKTKNLLGFNTRNSMNFCAWTGSSDGGPAVYFNAQVTNGAVTLDLQDLTLYQGANSITSLSYWADNSSAAVAYCPDCNREVPAGGAISGIIYDLPRWLDRSQRFTILFQGQSITVNDASGCAAVALLGQDDDGLAALRCFRDRYLAGSAAGRQLIELYYRCSPGLIAVFDKHPVLREECRSVLLRFAAALQ